MGGRLHAVSRAEILAEVQDRIAFKRFTHILTVNPLMLAEAQSNPELARIFREAHLCVPESSGIAFIAKVNRIPIKEIIPGIDLMLDLCRLAAQKRWPVVLLGGIPGTSAKAGEALSKEVPGLKILKTLDGYAEETTEGQMISRIESSKPYLIFVAMGVPKQEKWIDGHKRLLGGCLAMGVGGSLDIFSGSLRRAPRIFRVLGLEWLFRLLQEPRRIGRIAGTFRAVFLAIFRPIS